jgi:DNA-directed RNA polymerase subunit RPC12/RpoP
MKKVFFSSENQQFERMLNYGIAAVKGKDLTTARRWLEKAARILPSDARSWLWLSATTDDPLEQRAFLERAVAADPANAAARRGLVLLSEKIDKDRLLSEGQSPSRPSSTREEDANAIPYQCPTCGGYLRFDITKRVVLCDYCGYSKPASRELNAQDTEQAIDFVLPTTRAHLWAEAQQRVACQNCGSISLIPPGQRSNRCPYCGSNRLVDSNEQIELIDPHAILVMQIDQIQAAEHIRKWLGSGLFTPDDLADKTKIKNLSPAYYPFWAFNGILEIPWRCEVNESNNNQQHWVLRSGTEFEFFDDILIPGHRELSDTAFASIEPFPLEEAKPFSPEILVGWTALSYDLALSDASLKARQHVIERARRNLYHKIEPGREKRNLDYGAGKWSGITFKNILLPLWVSTFNYRGKKYRVLVNGVTGKVGGERPRDRLKIVLSILFVLALISLVLLGVYWLTLR